MPGGYENCWVKNDLSGGTPGRSAGRRTHSARVTESSLDISAVCPESLSHTSANDEEFKIKCFDGRFNAENFTSLHESSIQGCIDQCSTHSGSPECVGVIFNIDLADGFDNCYLLNSIGVPNKPFNYTFAELVSQRSNASSPGGSNTSGNSSSGSSSKVWIAGPVIGVVVFLPLLAGGIFWWRWRSRSRPT